MILIRLVGANPPHDTLRCPDKLALEGIAEGIYERIEEDMTGRGHNHDQDRRDWLHVVSFDHPLSIYGPE